MANLQRLRSAIQISRIIIVADRFPTCIATAVDNETTTAINYIKMIATKAGYGLLQIRKCVHVYTDLRDVFIC